jgi:hypothetical protein
VAAQKRNAHRGHPDEEPDEADEGDPLDRVRKRAERVADAGEDPGRGGRNDGCNAETMPACEYVVVIVPKAQPSVGMTWKSSTRRLTFFRETAPIARK